MSRFFICLFTLTLITACTGQSAITPTPIEVSKLLATVEISPTANVEQVAATRSASSPTPMPPTATVIPTETPYVGVFIGEAIPEEAMVNFTEPLLGPSIDLAQPTANPQRCINVAIDTPYLTTWTTNPTVASRMGCPIQAGFGFFGQVQVFETGLMYFYPEINAVWAIRPFSDDVVGIFDYLENPADSSTTGFTPSAPGLIAPTGIFGDMWINVDGLREEMGFARTESQEIALGLQRFENGTFLLDSPAGQVYALVTDGTVLGPFLTSEIEPARIVSPTPTEPAPEATEEPQG